MGQSRAVYHPCWDRGFDTIASDKGLDAMNDYNDYDDYFDTGYYKRLQEIEIKARDAELKQARLKTERSEEFWSGPWGTMVMIGMLYAIMRIITSIQ